MTCGGVFSPHFRFVKIITREHHGANALTSASIVSSAYFAAR